MTIEPDGSYLWGPRWPCWAAPVVVTKKDRRGMAFGVRGGASKLARRRAVMALVLPGDDRREAVAASEVDVGLDGKLAPSWKVEQGSPTRLGNSRQRTERSAH